LNQASGRGQHTHPGVYKTDRKATKPKVTGSNPVGRAPLESRLPLGMAVERCARSTPGMIMGAMRIRVPLPLVYPYVFGATPCRVLRGVLVAATVAAALAASRALALAAADAP